MTLRINVLMGGPSAEHEVSLRSGLEIISNLNRSKYCVRAVVINRDKEFYFCDTGDCCPDIQALTSPDSCGLFKGPFRPCDCAEVWVGCDVALLALHGEFGEDGVIQGYLDTIGVPYTGSNVYSSAVAMNKITSKFIYEKGGITVPPYSVFGRNNPHVTAEDLIIMKNYLTALLDYVDRGIAEGKNLEEIINHSRIEGFSNHVSAGARLSLRANIQAAWLGLTDAS